MPARIAALAIAATLVVAAPAGAATVRSHSLPNGGPHAVAASADGQSVFVGARDCSHIGAFNTGTRAFAQIISAPPLPCAAENGVFSMTQGPDGKLYFTLYDDGPVDGTGSVARVNPDGTGFESAVAGVHPLDIVTGPDGYVWFTVNGPPGKVGRINPATFGVETWNVPGNVQSPRGIISAPDGNLYVPGGESGDLFKVTTATPPVITEINLGLNGPSFGEVGPDGKLWFTLFEGNGLVRYDQAGLEPLAVTGLPGGAWDVAFGEDGKAYVTLFNDNQIAQVIPATAAITPLPLTTTTGLPAFIASSPSGNLFAAGKGENTLFEVTPDVPPRVTTGAASGVTRTTASIAATVNPRGSSTRTRVVFGETTAYGQTTADSDLGGADAPQNASATLTGLKPGTTYHYRAEATNTFGTTAGADQTFTTARPGVIGASVRAAWRVKGRLTRVRVLTARKVPAGATIQVRCNGKGCPAKKKRTRRVAKAKKAVKLAKPFRKRKLRPGTVVEVRITAPGLIGKVFRFTTRRSKVPRKRVLCLSPGAKRPAACP